MIDPNDAVVHGYADSNGVKIHYASLGKGQLVVMIHGIPEFWYTWRHQMEGLAATGKSQVVAIDQRGYNLSDKPKGKENYAMPLLMNDVVAVIRSLGREKAVLVGHDSGGRIAWNLALEKPQFVEKLIVVNLLHPYAQDRAKATIPEQQQRSHYAILNKAEGSEKRMTAESVSQRITDPEAKKKYLEAFQRRDFDFKNVMDYYRVNFPDEPYQMPPGEPKRLTVPLLMIHGLKDQVFVHAELNDTWDWVDKDMTLITLPDAGHFSQEEAPEFVTRSMVLWLSR